MNGQEISPLTLEEFEAFYFALYGKKPFDWQKRLAKQVCLGGWPSYIKLPTASGKTAAIDIAIFSLAYQAAESNRPLGRMTTPRRIFFVVDRRIIVNEAYRRASAAANMLRDVLDPQSETKVTNENRQILDRIARWLKTLTSDRAAPPLDCFELRGGIYRNDAWVRSLLQPTVLTSTVDQVGSRLLFRGYGVSDRNLSIHAALTANDSLIVLDEAHCSKPFSQTLGAIQRYRSEQWSQESVETPFHFVQMTATPPADLVSTNILQLTDLDYATDTVLEKRHGCSKPVRLILAANAKGAKLQSLLAKRLAVEAVDLMTSKGRKKIAIVVNRVAIAREAYQELAQKYPGRVHLMIGRMRPWDRDKLTTKLQDDFGSNATNNSASSETTPSQFVVATQCLEVGADLDFDGMVTQCASLDALRQRFGRLNRLGDTTGACGVIVAAEGEIPTVDKLDDTKPLDPIYGNAIARTWHWLTNTSEANAQVSDGEEPQKYVDFGIKKLDALVSHVALLEPLLAPAENAPVLMPAHMDMLCQTSPRPTPEPDISAYLHGPNRDCPEVRICWRADLDLSEPLKYQERWIDAVDLCPPSTAECLSVPLHVFRKWLRGEKFVDDSSDVLGETVADEDNPKNEVSSARIVLIWRGKGYKKQEEMLRSVCVQGANEKQIRPNDTIVIPVEFGGWQTFGHLPSAPPEPKGDALITFRALMGNSDSADAASSTNRDELKALASVDIADDAFLSSRARTILRIHPKLQIDGELNYLVTLLLVEAKKEDPNLSFRFWQNEANKLRRNLKEDDSWKHESDVAPLIVRLTKWNDRVISGEIVRYPGGVVWLTKRHESLLSSILPLPSFGDDSDELTLANKVALTQHLSDVHHAAGGLISALNVDKRLAATTLLAAQFHDIGKADPRFQAMLIDKPVSVAFMQQQLWAKSESVGTRARAVLPTNFRHEMLSLAIVDLMHYPIDGVDQELLKHQIAAHHGFARPFAPVCVDNDPVAVDLRLFNTATVTVEQRLSWTPAHQLDSGVPQRFWELNRKYGWWGLAYLESLVRLADWQASAFPFCGVASLSLAAKTIVGTQENKQKHCEPFVFEGIDGSNPLGYLCALGAFRTLSLSSPESRIRMQWVRSKGAWRPAISSSVHRELNEEILLDILQKGLLVLPEDHPAIRLAEYINSSGLRNCLCSVAESATPMERQDSEWLSCNYSDIASPDSISQLQTTRRDYHPGIVKGLTSLTTREHLKRTLFQAWDYADPIAGVSLHLEPREDRRHGYQWFMPSGDPTRANSGGMIGANRLALEAWPLFQSLPAGDKLATVGFRGLRANNTTFTWPIWNKPINLELLRSLLGLQAIQGSDLELNNFEFIGIPLLCRCRRILVGKTPNLTYPEPVFAV
jgi:CRISPR-associated endonuclease/helicase Cas3